MNTKPQRPQYGNLVQLLPDGSRKVLVKERPWPHLSRVMKEYIEAGYFKKYELKLAYSRDLTY